MKYGIGLTLMLALCGTSTHAVAATGSKAEVRKQIEMSMLVTGTIDIERDGSVAAHVLDQPDKLPAAVAQLLDKAVAQWRFEPVEVEGKIVRARSKMGVRVIAKQLDDGNYNLRIGSTSFGAQAETDQARKVKKPKVNERLKMTPPRYPEAAYMANISGTVYLLVKVNDKGDVDDVAAEQVNLNVLGNERQMIQARELLTKSSIAAARRWQFNVPTRENLGDDGYQVVRVPVDYKLNTDRAAKYGQWQGYIPGPKSRPEWVEEQDAKGSPDAMIAGNQYPVGQGPKLLTPSGS